MMTDPCRPVGRLDRISLIHSRDARPQSAATTLHRYLQRAGVAYLAFTARRPSEATKQYASQQLPVDRSATVWLNDALIYRYVHSLAV